MSAKHTPGPWRVELSSSVLIELEAGRFAECYAGTSANARLIAAAPELLEAAQWYMRVCPADDDLTPAFQAATKALRAAIAKATGASS